MFVGIGFFLTLKYRLLTLQLITAHGQAAALATPPIQPMAYLI
jgi:hypothetical protein